MGGFYFREAIIGLRLNFALFLLAVFFVPNIPAHGALDFNGESSRPTVNVLTWWGYLTIDGIRETIEQSCDVNLSFDQYFSNSEFLRRWRQKEDRYDLIIFSDTIYPSVASGIKRKGIVIDDIASKYHPDVQKKYKQKKYPKNVLFFIHSLTGFLWNPKTVSISRDDTVEIIFEKASGKLIVLLDDALEVNTLLFEKDKNEVLRDQRIVDLLQSRNVFFTNEFQTILSKENFAFAYSWSGDAIAHKNRSELKHLRFLVHPALSHVSTDLIAQLKSTTGAECVVRTLSSEAVVNQIAEATNYVSPFKAEIKPFRESSKNGISNIASLRWLSSPNRDDFQDIHARWERMKVKFTQ